MFIFFTFSLPDINGQKKPEDTTSLLHYFKKGKTEGHFRLYYMSTNNDEYLTDYYALAFGGGLKYQTKSFKGFQAGVGGFFIWNLSSSDLTKPDPYTNISNRYEIGQFDQANPANKKDLQRLEDFFIKYSFRNAFFKYGKQVIKTPFINPQDGRMRPTGEQGFWSEVNEIKKTKLEFGFITQISPRGTTRWYRGASSIGIYPSGVAISGLKSDYKYNLKSKGIGIVGINYSLTKEIKFQLWEYWVENIFNTLFLQVEGSFPISKTEKLIAGVQYVHQDPINKGGNTDPSKTYFDPTQQVNIVSARTGIQFKTTALKFNYSRITKDGRFLFPREWGREPLYTFLPRERNEGAGDVNAFTVNFLKNLFDKKFIAEAGFGYFSLPDVNDARLNKYSFPSYYQLNIDLKYAFQGFLEGLNTEILYVYKKNNGNIYNNLKNVINKTNMHQFNIIVNYNF